MFTGIISHIAHVSSITLSGNMAYLELNAIFSDLMLGESIAVNGVCLTVHTLSEKTIGFMVSCETRNVTNLNQLKADDYVNIERALLATSRMGGHYVSGHVDTTKPLHARIHYDDCVELIIGPFSPAECRYLVPKGSITLDGISLTINRVDDGMVAVMIVPHTLSYTTLATISELYQFNIEFDYVARIIAHQLSITHPAPVEKSL